MLDGDAVGWAMRCHNPQPGSSLQQKFVHFRELGEGRRVLTRYDIYARENG